MSRPRLLICFPLFAFYEIDRPSYIFEFSPVVLGSIAGAPIAGPSLGSLLDAVANATPTVGFTISHALGRRCSRLRRGDFAGDEIARPA